MQATQSANPRQTYVCVRKTNERNCDLVVVVYVLSCLYNLLAIYHFGQNISCITSLRTVCNPSEHILFSLPLSLPKSQLSQPHR